MFKTIFRLAIDVLDEHVVLRYIISGGTSAFVDLVVLYILNSLLGFHYLIAAILAYMVAFWVSFLLHKFWTFESHKEETHKQVIMYFGTSLFALGLNTLLMYIFVDYFHLVVLPAQFIVGALVAFISFFISRNLVFKYQKT